MDVLNRRSRRAAAGLAGLLVLGVLALGAQAQGAAHTFPQTGHTVSGLFWTYWQAHGGLAQQGYPLSEPFTEKSDLNGQTYLVQYFERAVFEQHPENAPPANVLLSQLGTFRYHAKYPAGAPGQVVNKTAGHFFAETGHWVGGAFWAYWQAHGGLAQQGYPLSDEFSEVSDLNGKSYTVQYFERAVFERHPENAPPFDVLLSQLGTFQLHQKYPGGAPTPVATAPPGGTSVPTVAATPGALSPTIRDLLAKSDAAMNALQAMKAHSVNNTTEGAVTTVDIADYQYQAPDRRYLKVTSPRGSGPAAVAEVIDIGTQHFERQGAAGPWAATANAAPFGWPAYNKVYVAEHALAAVLGSPTTINGTPVQVVQVSIAAANAPAQVDQMIQYFISAADYRDLREVTTVPAAPPSRTASGVYTSDFADFNVPNAIVAPTDLKP